jgi:hypothetical protein
VKYSVTHPIFVRGTPLNGKAERVIVATDVTPIEIKPLEVAATLALSVPIPRSAAAQREIWHSEGRFFASPDPLDPARATDHRGVSAMLAKAIAEASVPRLKEIERDEASPKVHKPEGLAASWESFLAQPRVEHASKTPIDPVAYDLAKRGVEEVGACYSIVGKTVMSRCPEPFWAVSIGLSGRPDLEPALDGCLPKATIAVFALGRLDAAREFAAAFAERGAMRPFTDKTLGFEERGVLGTIDDIARTVVLAAQRALWNYVHCMRIETHGGKIEAVLFDVPAEHLSLGRRLRELMGDRTPGEVRNDTAEIVEVLREIAWLAEDNPFDYMKTLPAELVCEMWDHRGIDLSLEADAPTVRMAQP